MSIWKQTNICIFLSFFIIHDIHMKPKTIFFLNFVSLRPINSMSQNSIYCWWLADWFYLYLSTKYWYTTISTNSWHLAANWASCRWRFWSAFLAKWVSTGCTCIGWRIICSTHLTFDHYDDVRLCSFCYKQK